MKIAFIGLGNMGGGMAANEMVNAAFETTLQQGVMFERRLFHGLFGSEDQKEGMAAFVEKRPGNWTGK